MTYDKVSMSRVLRVEKLGWIYVGVEIDSRKSKAKSYGILAYDRSGKVEEELIDAKPVIWSLDPNIDLSLQVKVLALKEIQANLEETAGLKYEIGYDHILLLDKEEFEKIARKSGSMYYQGVDRYKDVRRPLTAYFSPFMSASTGKVRSKRVLVVDIDGKVVYDDEDRRGVVVGYIDEPLTNPRALKLLKEYLASNGLSLSGKDRAYRLNPQSMKNKLRQFGVKEVVDR